MLQGQAVARTASTWSGPVRGDRRKYWPPLGKSTATEPLKITGWALRRAAAAIRGSGE